VPRSMCDHCLLLVIPLASAIAHVVRGKCSLSSHAQRGRKRLMPQLLLCATASINCLVNSSDSIASLANLSSC
jgi:hypothetical protein